LRVFENGLGAFDSLGTMKKLCVSFAIRKMEMLWLEKLFRNRISSEFKARRTGEGSTRVTLRVEP
jgi:hypothetical protein